MIRNNLSTRPFYNERAVRLALLVGAVVVAVATLFNVARVLLLARTDSELATQAAQDEARVEELRGQAAKLRASVDMSGLQVAANEARQANELIDKRTFSWTELLNLFEATLPADVRIVSVTPAVDEQRRTQLTVNLVALSVMDVEQFMRNLEASGAVHDPFVRTDAVTEQDQISAVLTAEYTPRAGGAPTSPPPAGGAQ